MVKEGIVVILSPSCVILTPSASVILNEVKNLVVPTQDKLREESDTKCHPERSEGSHEFLRYAQDRLQSPALCSRLLQNDYMKARASVIKISPGTINGKSRNRRHAYAYDSI